MKRRFFQFSLRGLLGLAALVCLLLGGRHLLETYGSFVEVSNAVVGKPMKVKGRLVRIFGPPKCGIEIDGYIANHDFPVWRLGIWIERSRLCCYEFDQETVPLKNPGEWMVDAELYPFDREDEAPLVAARSKTFMLEPDVPEAK